MASIRSPLGALGALMVLLQGIAAVALFPLESQPDLQRLMVWMMIGVTSTITIVVAIVVLWFAFRNPGLLFSPRDITTEVHLPLYGPGNPVPTHPPSVPRGVEYTFEVGDSEQEGQA